SEAGYVRAAVEDLDAIGNLRAKAPVESRVDQAGPARIDLGQKRVVGAAAITVLRRVLAWKREVGVRIHLARDVGAARCIHGNTVAAVGARAPDETRIHETRPIRRQARDKAVPAAPSKRRLEHIGADREIPAIRGPTDKGASGPIHGDGQALVLAGLPQV